MKTTALGMSEHGCCLLSGLLGGEKVVWILWSPNQLIQRGFALLSTNVFIVRHVFLLRSKLIANVGWYVFLFHSKFNQKINCERGHCSVKAKNYGMSGLLFQDVGLCWHFVYACAIHILIVLWVNKKGKKCIDCCLDSGFPAFCCLGSVLHYFKTLL